MLLVASLFAWGFSFTGTERDSPIDADIKTDVTPTYRTNTSTMQNWLNEEKTGEPSYGHPENVFLQRARHEDLMTFQAAMSFIHMLLVLFMTSIDLPQLAFVNLVIIAGLLFQEHTSSSLLELVSGVVVAQSLSLLALRHQLYGALSAAREINPNAQLVGVDAIVEQVGLVYCSIRLVAGAILVRIFQDIPPKLCY